MQSIENAITPLVKVGMCAKFTPVRQSYAIKHEEGNNRRNAS